FAAIVVAMFLAQGGGLPPIMGISMGAIIAIFAPFGDLAESFWKRALGVKDLGSIFPGHGGILDRCDSILFAALGLSLYLSWIG
ncbi:phosphatidate cytidylyltransferase, partial [bacterium]